MNTLNSLDSNQQQHGGHHDIGHDHHEHAEGYNGWIGSMKTENGLTDLSQLDKEDITILQHRDYDKFLNAKEKKRWTLYYMRVDDPLYNIVKNST